MLSFVVALELAINADGVIICMNLCEISSDTTYTASAEVEIMAYENEEDKSLSHEGLYFLVTEGTLTLSGFVMSERDSSAGDIELDGGSLVLGEGLALANMIVLSNLSDTTCPITVNSGNGTNSGYYIISFDSTSALEKVAIAEGDQSAYLKLTDALADSWEIAYDEDTNITYAQPVTVITEVYLDGASGSDDNTGGSAAAPVKTLDKAIEVLCENAETASTIYVINTVTLTGGSYSFGSYINSSSTPSIKRYESCNSSVMFDITEGEVDFTNISISGETTSGSAAAAVVSVSGGSVSIGSGATLTGTGSSYEGLYIGENGTAKISGGAVYYTTSYGTLNAASGTLYSYTYIGAGEANFSGATVSGNVNIYGGVVNATGGTISSITTIYSATVNASGSTFSSTLYMSDNSTFTLNSGRIEGTAVVSSASAFFEVNGGTVSNANLYVTSAKMYVKGGTITYASLFYGATLYVEGSAVLTSVNLANTGSKICLTGEWNSSSSATELYVGSGNQNDGQVVVTAAEEAGVAAGEYLSNFTLSTTGLRLILDAYEGDIVLRFQGVYVDTSAGNDSNDGKTKDTAVATFSKAGELLASYISNDSSYQKYIIVVDSATISSTDSLDMSGISGVSIVPYSTSISNLISVKEGGELSLTNVTVNGRGGGSTSSTTLYSGYHTQVLFAVSGGKLNLTDVSLSAMSEGAVNVSGGTVNMSGVSITGSTSMQYSTTSATTTTVSVYGINISGGEVVFSDSSSGTGSVTGCYNSGVIITGGNFKLTGGSITSNAAEYGGGVYIGESGVFEYEGGTISGNTATTGGGGIYWNCSNSEGLKIAENAVLTLSGNTATSYGGGLYIGGGSSHTDHSFTLDEQIKLTGNTAAYGGGLCFACEGECTITDCTITNNTAEYGSGIYVEAGTVEYNCANASDKETALISGNTATTAGSAVCIYDGAVFEHKSGTIAGSLAAYGTYKLNMEDASAVFLDNIYLYSADYPMILEGETCAHTKSITVYAADSFWGSIIIQGNEKLLNALSLFSVEGVDSVIVEGKYAIVGASSDDVWWDPSGSSSSDENGGTNASDAVKTLDKALELLAEKSNECRIVVCSTYTVASTVTKIDGTVSNASGETWNAELVRGISSSGEYLTSYMFDVTSASDLTISNIVMNGEYFNEATNTISSSLIYGYNSSSVTKTIELSNVTLKNN